MNSNSISFPDGLTKLKTATIIRCIYCLHSWNELSRSLFCVRSTSSSQTTQKQQSGKWVCHTDNTSPMKYKKSNRQDLNLILAASLRANILFQTKHQPMCKHGLSQPNKTKSCVSFRPHALDINRYSQFRQNDVSRFEHGVGFEWNYWIWHVHWC